MQKNVVYLLIALLILFALFSLFKPPVKEEDPEVAIEVAEEAAVEEEQEDEGSSFGRLLSIPEDKFVSFNEREQYLNAKRYREIKEKQHRDIAQRREKRQKMMNTPGVQNLRRGVDLLRNGRVDGAISEFRSAMTSGKDNKVVQATGYRYLAMAYQKKEDVPHYCLYMYKYLSLAEGLTPDEDARATIGEQKAQFMKVITEMRKKGHLE